MESKPPRAEHRRALLASLSTAGIALIAGSEVQGGIVVTKVNEDVGWINGVQTADFIGALPGYSGDYNAIRIRALGNSYSHSLLFRNLGSVYLKAAGGTFPYGRGRFAVIADAGQKWGQIAAGFSTSFAHIATNTSGGFRGGLSPFTNKFFALKFTIASSPTYLYRYGWIKASLTNRSFSNLFLHIDSYAYDDTGAQIAMGATGVPEPSSAIQLAALAAMTLGAAGVRRWKAAKAAATGSVGEVS